MGHSVQSKHGTLPIENERPGTRFWIVWIGHPDTILRPGTLSLKVVAKTTALTDERYPVEALRELGYEPRSAVSAKPSSATWVINGPSGQIIIRGRHLDSASNDIGFASDGSGVYRAIISEYDRGIGFDDAWIGRLSQAYKERPAMTVARAKGYVFKGREVINTPQGKKVQLRFAVR